MRHEGLQLNQATTFIGHLDVGMGFTNIDAVAEVIDEELKWASLWNEELLLYDGYIHCYAPMAAACLVSRLNERRSALRATISTLLESGILVPVSRGDGIFSVWEQEKKNVMPGEFLCLPKTREWVEYMEWVEKKATNQKRNVSLASLGMDFKELFMKNIFTALRIQVEENVCFALGNQRDVVRALKVLDKIQRELEKIDGDAFRRGEVEKVMGTHLGLEATFPGIYSEVWKRRPVELTSSDIDNYVVFQVSRWQSAMFQGLLAKRLKGISGLDPVHPVGLAHNRFFHDLYELECPSDLDLGLPEKSMCSTDQYDVLKALTASDVVEFRTGKETKGTFETYLRLRRLAADDESKVALVQHVYDEFLPKLHEFAKQRGLARDKEEWRKTLEVKLGRGTLAIGALARPILTFILPVVSPIVEMASIGLNVKWAHKQTRWDNSVRRWRPAQCNYYIPSTAFRKLPQESP